MSAPEDERRRFSKMYRELDAQELLGLFEKRETLSAAAVDCLRIELRLRGLDPDSLRATVPKAIPMDDEGSSGDATLAEAEVPGDEPSKVGAAPAADTDAEAPEGGEAAPPPESDGPSPAEAAATAASVRCAQCGTRNPAIEDVCLRCGQPLAEGAAHQTMSRRITESAPPAASTKPSGTVASATTGVIGIAALVFASYSLTLETPMLVLTAAATGIGIGTLAAAVVLHRLEKKKRDAEAAAAAASS